MRKIFHKWKAFKAAAIFPRSGRPKRFTSRSDHLMLKWSELIWMWSELSLQASVSTLNVKVHNSSARKQTEQVQRVWKGSQEKNRFSEKKDTVTLLG